MTVLQDRIAELIEQHGSLRATARVLECDAGYLSRLQSGEKDNPEDWLLRRMKLRRVVSYERLSASPAPTEEPRTDGVGAREEPWRKCLFCGCNTNARVRACCEKGRRADLNAVCASGTDGATEEPIAPGDAQ